MSGKVGVQGALRVLLVILVAIASSFWNAGSSTSADNPPKSVSVHANKLLQPPDEQQHGTLVPVVTDHVHEMILAAPGTEPWNPRWSPNHLAARSDRLIIGGLSPPEKPPRTES